MGVSYSEAFSAHEDISIDEYNSVVVKKSTFAIFGHFLALSFI